ncbi:cytochrome P450 CYP736A12-like [Quercus robur]|uniref:cytochrome P450 CYP736A12-like n=1 Tax=Quercus robur TaxID=38942 RepID=UPI00216285DE|nr:cytochrome P450 CYP736A12-like [Quercus robur]
MSPIPFLNSIPKMSPLTLAIFLLLSIWTFIHILSRPKDHKNQPKLPPGPRSLPIIGSLHMLGSLPHRALHSLAKKYGPIMSLRLGHVPTIVVSSPQAAELFLKTHDTIFASRPKLQVSEYLSYGTKGMAFSEYGSYWRNIRKLCTLQLLSVSKIDSFAPMRKEEVGSLVQSLKKAAAAHEVVDLSGKVCELNEETTCRMIFGRSSDDRFDLKTLIAEVFNLAGAFNLADYVPYLGALDLQGLTRRMKKCSKALDVVLENIIKEHEKIPSSGQQDRETDFIDTLLSLMNQPMNPRDEQVYIIDRTNIKAIILDMISGAYDTSVAAIEWTFSELLRYPRVMKHVQEELECVVGMNRMVEETDLAKLPYLDMVVKESLRLHPVGPLLVPRESMEDIEVNGYYVPKKSRIIINFWAIGRDPCVWSDNVEEFYPERFINSNIDLKGRDFQLIPFGSGRRGCPGMNLGLTTVKYVLAQLLHCFHWMLPSGILPNKLDMSESFGLSIRRAKHLSAMPTYRLQLPPGPRSLPIIGNLHMLGSLPHRALHSLAKKYGPIMSLRLGNVPTIVVSSPQAAELFLKTHDTIFASRPKLQVSEYLSYGTKGMAFSEYGSYWRNIRKLCTLQLLSVSKIDSFAPMRKEEVGSLVQSLKKAAAAHEVVDVSGKVCELNEETTCRMIFGRSSNDRFDLKTLIEEVLSLTGAFNLADYVPYLGAFDLQGLTRRMKKCSKALDIVLENIIKEHEKIPSSGQQDLETDFIDTLLSLMNQPMNPHDEQVYIIDRTNIKAIILDMISGAYDTSVAAIEWTFSELLRYPRVMKHVQEELECVVGMNRMVEETDLAKLPYLDTVVKESLRLHPVGPLLVPHESMEDIEVNGYYVPKKSRIIINFWAIGRDPCVWSDNMEEFYPERFINSNIDLKGRDFQLIPFGSGRRGCPGMHLGLTTVKYVLAQLLHCFHWVLPSGMLPNDLDMSEKFGLSMRRAKHLSAMPTYRLLA